MNDPLPPARGLPPDADPPGGEPRRNSSIPQRRAYQEALALVGYLTADSAEAHLPYFRTLPDWALDQVNKRLGACAEMPERGLSKPSFRRIDEPDVLQLVREVSSRIPATLNNLTGFEWVEIDRLVAGHYVTGALPAVRESPNLAPLDVAKFCLLSYTDVVSLPRTEITVSGQEANVLSDGAVGLGAAELDLEGRTLVLRYHIGPVLRPVRALSVDDQLVALTGLGRLAILRRLGVLHALAVISYGYGMDALQHFPSVPYDVIASNRPPLVRDFLDASVSTAIPVRAPATNIRIRTDVSNMWPDG